METKQPSQSKVNSFQRAEETISRRLYAAFKKADEQLVELGEGVSIFQIGNNDTS